MTNGRIAANPVGWFEIYVAEMDRAKDFYADVDGAAAARVTARGSKIDVEKQSIGEMGFIAIVGDREGNSIGLHSRV